jgi:hypothetical protein
MKSNAVVRALVLGLACFAASLGQAGPTLAECGFLDPWPPFEQVAPRAATVIVGEVVEDRDASSSGYLEKFGFRVDSALRGTTQPGTIVDIAFVPPGPPGRCPDTWLNALLGDVLAIALDAKDGGFSYNSAAWLKGEPDDMQHGLGTISWRQLQALFELPRTDSLRSAPQHSDGVSRSLYSPVCLAVSSCC